MGGCRLRGGGGGCRGGVSPGTCCYGKRCISHGRGCCCLWHRSCNLFLELSSRSPGARSLARSPPAGGRLGGRLGARVGGCWAGRAAAWAPTPAPHPAQPIQPHSCLQRGLPGGGALPWLQPLPPAWQQHPRHVRGPRGLRVLGWRVANGWELGCPCPAPPVQGWGGMWARGEGVGVGGKGGAGRGWEVQDVGWGCWVRAGSWG